MADAIQSISIPCTGGLITSIPDSEQSRDYPGSAKRLVNLVVSPETNGYKRIGGFTKITDDPLPFFSPFIVIDSAGTTTPGTLPAGSTSLTIETQNSYTSSSYFLNQSFYFIKTPSQEYTITDIQFINSSRQAVITFTPALIADIDLTGVITSPYTQPKPEALIQVNTPNNYGFFICGGIVLSPSGYIYSAYHCKEFGSTSTSFRKVAERRYDIDNNGITVSSVDVSGSFPAVVFENMKRTPPPGARFLAISNTGNYTIPLTVSPLSRVSGGSVSLQVDTPISDFSSSDFYTNFADYSIYYAGPAHLDMGTNYNKSIEYAELTEMSPSGDYPIRRIFFKHPTENGVVDISIHSYFAVAEFDINEINGPYYHIDMDSFYSATSSFPSLFSFPSFSVFSFYKNHLFMTDGHSNITFSSPYLYTDLSPANGSGSIMLDDDIVAMRELNDALIIFCKSKIYRLTGSSSSDFQVSPITKNVGTSFNGSIQNVDSDIIFLTDGGFRTLSSVSGSGEFSFPVISDKIKPSVDELASYGFGSVCSVYDSKNSRYLVFRRSETSDTDYNSKYFDETDPLFDLYQSMPPIGLTATKKFSDGSIEWSEINGIFINSIGSFVNMYGSRLIIFSRRFDPYVQFMANRYSDFNGDKISTKYQTPYIDMGDQTVRKTFTKLHLFHGGLTSSIANSFSLWYRLGNVSANNASNSVSPYNVTESPSFAISYYDSTVVPLIGSGSSMSFLIEGETSTSSNLTATYSFDSFSLEYLLHSRR